MATLALSVVGSIVGGAIGGPFGAAVGHLGRTLREHGHTVRLMSPEYVRPL